MPWWLIRRVQVHTPCTWLCKVNSIFLLFTLQSLWQKMLSLWLLSQVAKSCLYVSTTAVQCFGWRPISLQIHLSFIQTSPPGLYFTTHQYLKPPPTNKAPCIVVLDFITCLTQLHKAERLRTLMLHPINDKLLEKHAHCSETMFLMYVCEAWEFILGHGNSHFIKSPNSRSIY